jgi:hypothetical protein
MRWDEFVARSGDLGERAVERIQHQELLMVSTLRRDGSPRISPCEAYVVDGDLLVGMMWQSRKALDLIRDPRIAVHSVQCEKTGASGDVKLYGVALDVLEPVRRVRYCDLLEWSTNWRPVEPFHLFALDVQEAGYITFGEERRAMRWDEQKGLKQIRQPDA